MIDKKKKEELRRLMIMIMMISGLREWTGEEMMSSMKMMPIRGGAAAIEGTRQRMKTVVMQPREGTAAASLQKSQQADLEEEKRCDAMKQMVLL